MVRVRPPQLVFPLLSAYYFLLRGGILCIISDWLSVVKLLYYLVQLSRICWVEVLTKSLVIVKRVADFIHYLPYTKAFLLYIHVV